MKEAIAAVVPIIHIILMVIGLLMLRSRTMDEIARALWA